MLPTIVSPKEQAGLGGALEGADRFNRETALWSPSSGSPDQIINPAKDMADARARDMVLNDGFASGTAALHRDNIVGSQYQLNCQPNLEALGIRDEVFEDEFQRIVEARFGLVANSEECWFDARRRLTFVGLCRMVSNGYVMTGEALGTAEWLRESRRPCRTAIQLISPTRLSNPNGAMDTRYLRRGIEQDRNGRPIAAHIRDAYPGDYADPDQYRWTRVPWTKDWGRAQVLHIADPLLPSQTRGISEMVAVLKQMRMTKKFQEVTLQNAVINASFAATIESDLPSAEAFAQLGVGTGAGAAVEGLEQYLLKYMGILKEYAGNNGRNITLDGSKIAHLVPGSKLNMKQAGDPGGIGSTFEQSLLRHIAAALGLSYEQFSRDYTKTNYSSARASMNETWKAMQAKKTSVVDRFATHVYRLWFEEDLAAGNIPLPAGKTRDWFYEPLVKDALTRCSWIGAARGQIDETKETEAAQMRIDGNFSTLELECARMGQDWRAILRQRARERKMMESLGLDPDARVVASPAARASSAATAKNEEQDDEL